MVLADRDKDALDADVARTLNGSGLHWVTRKGAPHSAKDLETVSAAHAKTIILLHPDNDEVGGWAGGRVGEGVEASAASGMGRKAEKGRLGEGCRQAGSGFPCARKEPQSMLTGVSLLHSALTLTPAGR